MLQLNFLRNNFLTVRALQRGSRLCKGVISSSFWGKGEQWYSSRNWITICQGCYSHENTVCIIEHHKVFIFILWAVSVEQTFCWHEIIKLKWRILNHVRNDSTEHVRVVSKCRHHKTSGELVIDADLYVPRDPTSLADPGHGPHSHLLSSMPSPSSPYWILCHHHVFPIVKT